MSNLTFKLPDSMSSSSAKRSDQRPHQLKVSKSFSRVGSASPILSPQKQRASTMQNSGIAGGASKEKTSARMKPGIFEKSTDDEDALYEDGSGSKNMADAEELPIELVSLTDSFIDSLSLKVHSTPPNVEKLSVLFQDFYEVAISNVDTHVAALSSRQHRKSSPARSVTSISSTASKLRAKAASINSKDRPKTTSERKDSEQQMLTVEEIAERKQARKLLEIKRVALEEAVERRVCESIYDRIWRHRSTQDEAQDEKLRSKTAALSVVGIGLTELGVNLGQISKENPEAAAGKEQEIRDWLEDAREQLAAMNDEKYPMGKLLHLKAAHKNIVDTLSHFHPSSSADEILPMLIYTLITSPPEGTDVISNLYFIQRFRNESKIDGEAAYCLTNLEAAINFLENVDLATLRDDEAPTGPHRSPTPDTKSDSLVVGPSSQFSPEVTSTAKPSISKTPSSSASSSLRPGMQPHNRRLSDMFQQPVQAVGAASDAMLSTADQGFKTIGNSLGESYKFLLGKMKEREGDPKSPDIVVPKTLDEARKLVSTPPPEDDISLSSILSRATAGTGRALSDSGVKNPEDKVLSFIGGRGMDRERSSGSTHSAASSIRRVATMNDMEKSPSPQPSSSGNPDLVESMRNLGSSLNPMNKFAMPSFPTAFGRRVATPSKIPDGGVADLTTAFPDLAPALPPKETQKIAPPIKRFIEIQNPGDLKISEVTELLRDYRRLAGALKVAGAF
ncbi:hypothetical protein BJ878DRAFT_456697 [Calycina marina]|uniref:VPS9 domain-containing protein n=1 Tax=Calycina marina TaxID=1763456 RepID=A0A9P8CH03_9HELO|nr:hypothetical protein BJ878DRAFT_456697 [Calycina marina]